MTKESNIKGKRGFTIIEVVLVLAVAGLIFLMVFLAFPALRRSQNDTQRRDQLSMMVTQITQYQANNRNRLPACGGNTSEEVDNDADETGLLPNAVATLDMSGLLAADGDAPGGSTDGSCAVTAAYSTSGGTELTGAKDWVKFYKNYLLAQDTDQFEDPNGQPYSLEIKTCTKNGCDQVTDANFIDQNYKIRLTYNSTCDGETIIYNSGARKITVAYKLEGGGTFCQGN